VERRDARQQSYSRVEAEGRLFDLCYDRFTKAWSLERTLN
jgi:hypothetical protein